MITFHYIDEVKYRNCSITGARQDSSISEWLFLEADLADGWQGLGQHRAWEVGKGPENDDRYGTLMYQIYGLRPDRACKGGIGG